MSTQSFNDLEIVWLYSPKQTIGFDAEIRDTRRNAELVIECCRTGDQEIKNLLMDYFDYAEATFQRTWEIRASPTTHYYLDKELARIARVEARHRGEQQMAEWEIWERSQRPAEYHDILEPIRARRGSKN